MSWTLNIHLSGICLLDYDSSNPTSISAHLLSSKSPNPPNACIHKPQLVVERKNVLARVDSPIGEITSSNYGKPLAVFKLSPGDFVCSYERVSEAGVSVAEDMGALLRFGSFYHNNFVPSDFGASANGPIHCTFKFSSGHLKIGSVAEVKERNRNGEIIFSVAEFKNATLNTFQQEDVYFKIAETIILSHTVLSGPVHFVHTPLSGEDTRTITIQAESGETVDVAVSNFCDDKVKPSDSKLYDFLWYYGLLNNPPSSSWNNLWFPYFARVEGAAGGGGGMNETTDSGHCPPVKLERS